MFDDGHISSGTRWSRTYAASRPRCTEPSARDLDVVDDAHPVAEPVGAAPLQRLPDARQPERLAGVDGEVGVLPPEVLERVQVPGRREARLGPGDVEAGHARGRGSATTSSATSRERAACRIAVSRVPTRIGWPAAAASRSPSRNPSLHRLDDLDQVEAAGQVELGGVADLGVDHPVGGQVLGALGGDPAQRRPRSASRRRCGRRCRGSAPASRCRPTRRTRLPARRRPGRAAGRTRSRRPGR